MAEYYPESDGSGPVAAPKGRLTEAQKRELMLAMSGRTGSQAALPYDENAPVAPPEMDLVPLVEPSRRMQMPPMMVEGQTPAAKSASQARAQARKQELLRMLESALGGTGL